MANGTLNNAKKAKMDEFYTQMYDIENELVHYREHFRGKTVLCNCDDPYESNFFKYFVINFNVLGLKKLICTCYDGSPVQGKELPLLFDVTKEGDIKRCAHKVIITRVPGRSADDDGYDLSDIRRLLTEGNTITTLRGNGDFRSEECIELLKEADIVCTNPPFSLFREYVAQLVKYGKKFLIIGNQNAITYKEIFPLIKENKLWVGVTPMSKGMHFVSPQGYVEELIAKGRTSSYVIKNGKYFTTSPSIWFTNLPRSKRNEEMILWKSYERDKEDFPKYDNYDAINVDKVSDIPYDYDGVMGVPITFLDKYNPKQFEIVGCTANGLVNDKVKLPWPKPHNNPFISSKPIYQRILIRKKPGPTSEYSSGDGNPGAD